MKALTLLAVLLCLEEAWALKCYSCINQEGNTCQNDIQCSNATACYSVTISYKNNDKLQTTKNCTSSCTTMPTINLTGTFQEASVYCCSTDLCNGAGAQGPGATTVGLMLVASVLTTLLGTSV